LPESFGLNAQPPCRAKQHCFVIVAVVVCAVAYDDVVVVV